MEVVDDFPHAVEREVLWVDGKHPPAVHVVYNDDVRAQGRRGAVPCIDPPMSVHMVSSGMPAAE